MRRFEVDGSTYPWEVHDEGIETILDNMTSLAGINTVYLICLMHHEGRPLTSKQFPHNPVRARWNTEDSCVYFHPHWELYGRIKPAVSSHEWLRSTDWLKVVVNGARVRGLKVGAEISHTPIPASVLKDNPDFQQRDINDAPKGRLCANHPDVREYLLALFGDVATHYGIDFIQTCMYLYSAGGPRQGTCFCRSCRRAAEAAGFDLAAAIPVLKANPQAQPQLDQWLAFRRESTARTYRLLAERIHGARPGLEFRLNDVLPYSSGLPANRASGLYLEDLRGVIDSCVIQDHTEQRGLPDEAFTLRKSWLAENRRLLGPEIPLLSGVAVRPKATDALIRRGVQVAVESGADGIACKHYDGAAFAMLRAVRDGLGATGVKGLTAIKGMEAESMTLSGCVAETYLDESCIRATGDGTAVSKCALPSGSYDIVVSYAGGKEGPGSMALSVGGREKLTWKWDAGVGSWKRQTIPQVALRSGDEIKLVGSTGARVDFVEFVPRSPRNRDKALGAFLGAAIGDAMGGPLENLSAEQIRKARGEITGFLPYAQNRIHPGAALHPEPGSITDDTYIRVDITRFYLSTERPRTPRMLVDWLLDNASFGNWWAPAINALKRIRDGKATAEDGGLTHPPGGGGAWWTPVGIVHAGNPDGAATEVRSLCRPWKGPLEQNIIGAVHAGTAEAQREGATADSVTDVILNACGPEARKYMERAAEIGRGAKSFDELQTKLYGKCLSSSILFAEQQPLALAAFVFGRGDPRRAIPVCVMIGRDCDSTASNVGGWCGGLHGESGLPKEWIETVCQANRRDFDLRDLGEKLLTVRAF